MKHEQLANPVSNADQPDCDDSTSPDNAAICPACGADGLAASPITTVFRTQSSFAVVRDIPAIVCQSCHEEYLDDRTATLLDLMRGGNFTGTTPTTSITVPVYAFPADAGGTS